MLEHVVVVTDSLCVDGGSAKVALTSAVALAQAGVRVTVFAAAGEPSAELVACKNLRIVTTRQSEALGSRNRLAGAVRGLWNARAFAMMADLLAELDPARTIVHVHGWTKALSSSVVASVVRARFPVVVTLHEYFTACPTGCLYLHRDRKVCTLAPMSPACLAKDCDSRNYAVKMYRVVRQLIQRTAGRIPDGILHYISVSEFSRNIIQPMLPAGALVHAVDNPVEAVRAPRRHAEANAPFVFVGRLSAEKGGAILAEAARVAGVEVVFVGDGPERGEIARINPAARCTGWLDRAGVSAELQRARAVVVPSLWYETFGLVVLEAAALGIPAIVPSGTAVYDRIVPGENGLAFERGSVADLAAQLRAFSDPRLVRRLSQGAYDAFWRQPRTMSTHVSGLLATYRGILAAVPAEQIARAS